MYRKKESADDIIGAVDNCRSNELYQLLAWGLPKFQNPDNPELLRVYALARYLNVSATSIYAWFDRGRLSHKKLRPLVGIEGSKLTYDLLVPWTSAK